MLKAVTFPSAKGEQFQIIKTPGVFSMGAVYLYQTPTLPFLFCLYNMCHNQKKIIQIKYFKA